MGICADGFRCGCYLVRKGGVTEMGKRGVSVRIGLYFISSQINNSELRDRKYMVSGGRRKVGHMIWQRACIPFTFD